MIDKLSMLRYVYCRRRVEYLLKQPITDENLLEDAFTAAYANSSISEQVRAADEAEKLMRQIETNIEMQRLKAEIQKTKQDNKRKIPRRG